ncbi:MAG: hypothetical protein HY911_14965 [Desulfobacterales bacterium]|nr:hypothetical protein [Desulfobacterales bacterium]
MNPLGCQGLFPIMVDHIVTEFGAVKRTACLSWMRAEKIISIAYLDFREELIQTSEKMKIWRGSNKKGTS